MGALADDSAADSGHSSGNGQDNRPWGERLVAAFREMGSSMAARRHRGVDAAHALLTERGESFEGVLRQSLGMHAQQQALLEENAQLQAANAGLSQQITEMGAEIAQLNTRLVSTREAHQQRQASPASSTETETQRRERLEAAAAVARDQARQELSAEAQEHRMQWMRAVFPEGKKATLRPVAQAVVTKSIDFLTSSYSAAMIVGYGVVGAVMPALSLVSMVATVRTGWHALHFWGQDHGSVGHYKNTFRAFRKHGLILGGSWAVAFGIASFEATPPDTDTVIRTMIDAKETLVIKRWKQLPLDHNPMRLMVQTMTESDIAAHNKPLMEKYTEALAEATKDGKAAPKKPDLVVAPTPGCFAIKVFSPHRYNGDDTALSLMTTSGDVIPYCPAAKSPSAQAASLAAP